jgi:hypothetical protein
MPIITTGNAVKFGKLGHKYKYTPGNKRSRQIARKKAVKQGQAISISKLRRGQMPRI